MLVKRAGRSRIKDGRGGAAAGISLALHLGVGALAGVLLHGPGSLLADVGTGDSGSIDVGIEEATLPLEDRDLLPAVTDAPKPIAALLEAIAPAAPRVRAPKPRPVVAAHRPPAAPLITTAGSTPITSTVAAPEEAPPAPRTAENASHASTSVPQIAPQATTSAMVAAAPSPVRGGSSAAGDPTRAPRSTPVFLPADVATYLRAQDEFPSLPSSLRHRGAHYQAKLEICVAADGRVTDVGFRSEPAPALDSVLQAAVRGWRYRPFLVDGVATPFCHRMIVSYEIG
jgi:outer membrane biosynthesis protein TonB